MKSIKLFNMLLATALLFGFSSCDEEYRPSNGGEDSMASLVEYGIFKDFEKDDMVLVKGGTFLMGAQSSDNTLANYDADAASYESPVHQVTLSDFYIGKYEVTQQIWEYVMRYSGFVADGTIMYAYAPEAWLGMQPSSRYGLGDYFPTYYVSYEDVVNIFIPRLNKLTGLTFRLPTEAEWEYAARGGEKSNGYKYSGSDTVEDVAWTYTYPTAISREVGTKAPNELGIYDMSGNVWEWCSDWYRDDYYSMSSSINPTGPIPGPFVVIRGGGWLNTAKDCRVARRGGVEPNFRDCCYGFRLACSCQ